MTAPNAEEAARIGRTLVEEGLAACVNVFPEMRSIYRWQGELCDDAEAVLIAKAPTEKAEALVSRVVDLHPYDCPCVLVLSVEGGNAAYLDWIRGTGG